MFLFKGFTYSEVHFNRNYSAMRSEPSAEIMRGHPSLYYPKQGLNMLNISPYYDFTKGLKGAFFKAELCICDFK